MLEKIGLPPKPALRGNNWVVDASNCQGCSAQFTFINRKHHCRRCGGLFCNSCTQQRIYLRGQGDSPVRICEPCKKLEEAARFEMRQGRRAGRGSLKSTPRDEDEVLNQVLGHNRELSASSSSTKGFSANDDGETQLVTNDNPNILGIDVGSTTPDELRQQALEEKKKYKILKGDGKSEEALRAFKKGKELERQADALEIHLRKTRRKMSASGNLSDVNNRGTPVETGNKTKSLPHAGKDKDDLISELRELGWSDLDLHKEDRKSTTLSLEGELSTIIGEVIRKSGEEKGSRIDKSQVVALKKKALTLKREGKLAEAKEELKRAKILEKQLEEQELLAEAEDSDDELSALIRGMDDDQEEFSVLHDQEKSFSLDDVLHIPNDLDGNFEVTDEDMMDPELAGTLESLGWTEPEQTAIKSQPFDKEALLGEIQSLKREALNQKRTGNTEEAMEFLKKAKLLERSFNTSGSEGGNNISQKTTALKKSMSSEIAGTDSTQLDEINANSTNNVASAVAPKSRLMIQRELLSLKKNALKLRREGKLNEAEEEMRKGAALERQLMEMDNPSNPKAPRVNSTDNVLPKAHKHLDIRSNLLAEEGSEDEVTDQDMSDPTYLSLLKDLGWNDDNSVSNSLSKPSKKESNHFMPANDASLSKDFTNIMVGAPRKSRGEIQRELLDLKRKALLHRREGKTEDAEEVLKMAKALEIKMAEMEAPKSEALVDAKRKKDEIFNPPVETDIDEERNTAVSEEDMHNPVLNSMLTDLGWKDDEFRPVKGSSSKLTSAVDPSVHDSSSGIPSTSSRSKEELQRELLGLKRKALDCRRKGEIEEAEEILRMAKSLEAQMEDFGSQEKDLLLNVSKSEKPVLSESSNSEERHGSSVVAMELDKGSLSMVRSNKSAAESSVSVTINNERSIPSLKKSDNLIPVTSQPTGDKHSFFDNVSASSENLAEKMKATKAIGGSSSVNSSQTAIPSHLDSSENLSQSQRHQDSVTLQKRERTHANEKPNISEANAVQDHVSPDQISLRQEILAYKRKAVTLKREGKLSEAKEELRQAKLLEKSLEDGGVQPNISSTNHVSDASHVVQKKQPNTSPINNVSDSFHVVQKKPDSSNVAAKPLSSRDRFKLQQESLGHKRQAMKLRREGRTEEAEAEFEKAKAIENQLEELAAHDSKSDAADDVTVEDFLDPQLLSALKAIGLDDVSAVSRGPERQEPAKSNVTKIENSNPERIQLEERIKEEKLKALNLKRSGKQAEALDALRRAKMYEKKLISITSG